MKLSHPLSILRREFLARTAEDLKPKPAVLIPSDMPQLKLVEEMCTAKVGCVLVTDSNQKVIGVITDRDVLNKWALEGRTDKSEAISIMAPKPQMLKKNASIARIVHMMATGGFRHVPIIFPGDNDIRLTSSKDFVDTIHRRLTSRILEPDNKVCLDDNLLDQFFGATVDVLKPDPPLALNMAKKVSDAVALMRKNSKGAVLVLDSRRHISGIFTERDYLRNVVLTRGDPSVMLLQEVMTPRPRTIPQSSSIALAFSMLSEGGHRHIPLVNDQDQFVAILSVRNFLSYLSASIVSSLETYEG